MLVGVCRKFLEKLVLSWCWEVTTISLKMTSFGNDITCSLNIVDKFAFWYWIIKCSSKSSYVTNSSYDLFYRKVFAKKCSDFKERFLKTLKIGKLSVNLATSNFQELLVMNFDLKSSWFKIKIFFLRDLSQSNREGMQKCKPPLPLRVK